MKKIFSLGLVLVCSITLAACGDSEEPTSNSSSSQSSSEQTTSSSTSETAPEEEGDFVATAKDAYFDGTYLKGNTYTIKITDYRVIQPGEIGNEYGDVPVIAFWYDTMVNPDYDNSRPIEPNSAWIMNFEAIQDNDPNLVNELGIASLPDDAFLDTQSAEIKPGGTVSNAVAYELSDTTTPVKLVAGSILGDSFGEAEFPIE